MSLKRAVVCVASGLYMITGCSQGQPDGRDPSVESAESESALTAAQKALHATHRSAWGYDALLPYAQLDAKERDAYRRMDVPLAAVGAVIVQNKPFRATASYLGEYAGEHLFAVAEHVVLDNTAIAVELGTTDADKLRVEVAPHPIFSSVAGDTAILRASKNVTDDVRARLTSLPHVKLAFAPAAAVLERNPDAVGVVAGRAIHGGTLNETATLPEIYTPAMAQSWKDAQREADGHLDERAEGARAGDVFAVAPCDFAARGLSQPLRDPDGLAVGAEGAVPFLAARPDWAPESIAATYRSAGRLSGAPVMVATKRGVFAIAIHWTKGMPSDVRSALSSAKASPRTAFGRVVVKQSGTEAKLSLEAPAPFAYASTLARVGSDLALALTTPVEQASGSMGPSVAADARPALEALADEGYGNAARLLSE